MKIPILLSCLFAFTLTCCEVFAACAPQPGGAVTWHGDSVTAPYETATGSFRGSGRLHAGFIGAGFLFGGGQDALSLPTGFRLRTQEFTFEGWIKRADTNRAGLDPEGGQVFGGSARGISFGLTHEGRLYVSQVGVTNFYSTSSIRDTNWHHVAIARAGTNLRFYSDGALVTDVVSSTVFELAGPYAIGGLGTPFEGVAYGFLGWIDELAIYDRPLDGAGIAAIFAAGREGKCEDGTTIESISVTNPGFEELTGKDLGHFNLAGRLLDGHYSAYGLATSTGFNTPDAVPGWTITDTKGSAGTFNPQQALFPQGLPEGQNVAWINVVGYLSQTLAAKFQAGRSYHLSVDVGAPAGLEFPGFSIGIYAGGQAVALTQNTFTSIP